MYYDPKSLEQIEVDLFVRAGDYDHMCLIWSFDYDILCLIWNFN
jgi:hypothetical protein